MKIGVIGGYGFLGSHLVDELVAGGNEVLILDDLTSCWLDDKGEPRFENPSSKAIRVERGDELLDCEVLVNLGLRHPIERELAIYRLGFVGFVSDFAKLVLDSLWGRTLRRVVVVGALEALDHEERTPLARLVRSSREVLAYVHRPPKLDVEFVHLPELYGPRQLPEAGWVAALLNDATMTYTERFANLGFVRDAAILLRERIEYPRHRGAMDVTVGAPPVDPEDVLEALSDFYVLKQEVADRVVNFDRETRKFAGTSKFFLDSMSLKDGLAETISFYSEVER